jgi:hypothetical protein
MSRYLDLQTNCVLYGDIMLPQEAFFHTADTAEMKLVSCVFELARSIAELKLTETELALYSAAVLLSHGSCQSAFIRSSKSRQRLLPRPPPGPCPLSRSSTTLRVGRVLVLESPACLAPPCPSPNLQPAIGSQAEGPFCTSWPTELYCVSDRPGLRGHAEVRRIYDAVLRALRSELDRSHISPLKGDVTVCDAMVAKISQLRDISLMHMDALAKFKRSQPHLEFPPLHKELFSVDS